MEEGLGTWVRLRRGRPIKGLKGGVTNDELCWTHPQNQPFL